MAADDQAGCWNCKVHQETEAGQLIEWHHGAGSLHMSSFLLLSAAQGRIVVSASAGGPLEAWVPQSARDTFPRKCPGTVKTLKMSCFPKSVLLGQAVTFKRYSHTVCKDVDSRPFSLNFSQSQVFKLDQKVQAFKWKFTLCRGSLLTKAVSSNLRLEGRSASREGSTIFSSQSRRIPHPDHLVNIEDILSALKGTCNVQELNEVMHEWRGRVSFRLMMSLLSKECDWQRSLALHDWMMEKADIRPSIFAYNIVLRNVLKAQQWVLGEGLVGEMAEKGVSPDKYTFATLISAFGKAGKFDSAMFWFQRMEEKGISPDLVVFSTLIDLSGKLKDYARAVNLFSKMKASNIEPDRVIFNTMINMFGKAKMFREAEGLLVEMRSVGLIPDTVSYSTLIDAYAETDKLFEALEVFIEMKAKGCAVDLTTCNLMIDVYGRMGLLKEAESVMWSLTSMDLFPNVVTFNTMIKVYAEFKAFAEAIYLFRLMQKKNVHPNLITYNTMIKMYGTTHEHEKAAKLILQMEERGVSPDAVTYSTLISIYGKAGKYHKAANLFQALRTKGFPMDDILYQSMVVVYERAGLVGHAKRLLHELKLPNGVSRDTAINVLAKAGKIEEAARLFWRADASGEVKDVSVYRVMISLFVRAKRGTHAIKVYDRMRAMRFLPDSETSLLLLTAYGQLQLLADAKRFYEELQREGLVLHDDVHWKMMQLCGSAGKVEEAEIFFEKLKKQGGVSEKNLYLAMVSVYEKASRLNDASRVFQEMKMRMAVSQLSEL